MVEKTITFHWGKPAYGFGFIACDLGKPEIQAKIAKLSLKEK